MTDGARVEILRFGPRHCHCIWSLVEGVSGKGNVSVNRERETKEQILQVIFDVVLCVVHGYTTLPLQVERRQRVLRVFHLCLDCGAKAPSKEVAMVYLGWAHFVP